MSPLGNLLASFSNGAAPLCRRPSSLCRDALPKSGTSASPARACGFACLWETLAYMQGLGRVADIIRVLGWAWVMLQRGLSCIIETSFQNASQPMKHCFLEGTEVNTIKNCDAERWAVVRSVFLLLWVARALRGPCFFPVGFWAFWRACARAPSHKTMLFAVFCCVRVSFFLGCSFGGLCRARAIPCEPFGLGPGWRPESWHPRHHVGWSEQHA